VRTARLDGVRVLLVLCAVTAWPDLPIARQAEAGLLANLDVDPRFRVVVDGMRERSAAFRRQIARIGSAQMFRVRVLPEDRTRPTSGVDARTVFTFDRGVLARADIYLRMATAELIAHEMEHIVEQLDGIDLRVQAGNGVVWKSHDNSFETRRAIEAGRLVAQEVADGVGRGKTPVEAAAGGIIQRERDGGPLSEHTGRLSANGRFVALISAARLVERDRNDLRDVYVFDGETGGLTLESLGPLGQPADGESRAVDISADGRFVVFAAEAGNLTDPRFASGTSHVFLRDRVDGTTRLLTVSASGDPANGPSRTPVIDAAGTTVVFQSAATDLPAPGPANGIFIISIPSGAVTRLDIAAGGETRPGASMSPAISADGRYVVFASKANLTCLEPRGCPEDNAVADIYLRDTRTRVTRRISRSVSGGEPNGASYDPVISGDGRYVAFVSEAANLTRDPVRRGAQIYVHDLISGTTELITRTRGGTPANGSSLRPAMSHDGQRIAYQSLASDLLCDGKCKAGQADINLHWDVYLHDRRSGHTIRASRGSSDWMEYSRAPSLDASGIVVVFVTRHPVDDDEDGYDEDLVIQTHALPNQHKR
jgi:Tol biopolymer transport system component